VAKVRVFELAKEFGVESKVVMAKIQELGGFVRSASSTIDAPLVRKLTDSLQKDPNLRGHQDIHAWEEFRRQEGREISITWQEAEREGTEREAVEREEIATAWEEADREDAERKTIERLKSEEEDDENWPGESWGYGDSPEPRHVYRLNRRINLPPSSVVDLQGSDRTAPYQAEPIPCWRLGAATLIGVPDSIHLPPKSAIRNNIKSLSALLHEGFGIPSTRIKVLENPKYSEQVQAAIDITMQSVDPLRGGFLLYYAGHGWTDSQTGQLLLSLQDSIPSKSFTSLRFNALREQIADSNIPVRLVILDSCYSGAALDSLSGDVASSTAIEGTFVMTSSSATTRSRALETDDYTTFTGELIKSLTSGIPNAPKIITASAIFRYIKDVCSRRGWPEPHQMARNDGADLPLMHNAWNQQEYE
jgi:hypothetical protein